MFLKIVGISGEAQDAVHQGEIDVTSWRWKMAQQSSMMSGSGGGAGKATVNDIEIIHQIDRASPNFMRYCLTGRHIPEAILTMRKAGGTPLDFLKITLGDVVITGVEPTAANGHYWEKITLSFARVKQEYKVQGAFGTSNGTVTAQFDIKENLDR